MVDLKSLKRNDTAKEGDLLYLTKPIGVGILTTAEKKGILKKEHLGLAASFMMKLNNIGAKIAQLKGVDAMTDVTGFGLMGHLREMCEGSRLCATVYFNKVKQIANLEEYIKQGSIPGGTARNWDSYGLFINVSDEMQKAILCDPQTSGGLLIAVKPGARKEVEELLIKESLAEFVEPIGELRENTGGTLINVE